MNENIQINLNMFIQANNRQANDACQKIILCKSSPKKKIKLRLDQMRSIKQKFLFKLLVC